MSAGAEIRGRELEFGPEPLPPLAFVDHRWSILSTRLDELGRPIWRVLVPVDELEVLKGWISPASDGAELKSAPSAPDHKGKL